MGTLGFITNLIFIAALIISFMLIGLIWWHGRMIGCGVTSVERLRNQHFAQKCAKRGYVFVNPYDFGLNRLGPRLSIRPIAFPPDAGLDFYANYPINSY